MASILGELLRKAAHHKARRVFCSVFHHNPKTECAPTFYIYHALTQQHIKTLKEEFAGFVQPHDGKGLDYQFPKWLNLLINTPTLGYQA